MTPRERTEEAARHASWVRLQRDFSPKRSAVRARWDARLETALAELEQAEAAGIAAERVA